MAEVKFCGLTRPADAAEAVRLGASFAGVILASGPRLVDEPRAREVFDALTGSTVRRVGVFGDQPVEEVARLAGALALDVVQLHRDPSAERVHALRAHWRGEIWAVIGVASSGAPALADRAATADGIVLDTVVAGRSGGTGTVFDWARVAPSLAPVRGKLRVVVAGGLRPGNVAEAVRVLTPDVVDVSSGVESSPGVKDPDLMRAFAIAARPREER